MSNDSINLINWLGNYVISEKYSATLGNHTKVDRPGSNAIADNKKGDYSHFPVVKKQLVTG